MTVVVTGATGGIGSAMVRQFADRGDDVVAVARPTEALDELCADVPSAVPAPLDLERPGELPAALRDLRDLREWSCSCTPPGSPTSRR